MSRTVSKAAGFTLFLPTSGDHVWSFGRTRTSARCRTAGQRAAFALSSSGTSANRTLPASNPHSGQVRSSTHVQLLVSGTIGMARLYARAQSPETGRASAGSAAAGFTPSGGQTVLLAIPCSACFCDHGSAITGVLPVFA